MERGLCRARPHPEPGWGMCAFSPFRGCPGKGALEQEWARNPRVLLGGPELARLGRPVWTGGQAAALGAGGADRQPTRAWPTGAPCAGCALPPSPIRRPLPSLFPEVPRVSAAPAVGSPSGCGPRRPLPTWLQALLVLCQGLWGHTPGPPTLCLVSEEQCLALWFCLKRS